MFICVVSYHTHNKVHITVPAANYKLEQGGGLIRTSSSISRGSNNNSSSISSGSGGGGDRLCGLVVGVSGYRYRGPGFDPRRYQIF